MRPPLPTVKEEKTVKKRECLLNYIVAFILDNTFPFLNEAMDSSLIKINVFRSKEIIKGALYPFLGFQGFISEKPRKGPEEAEIGWGKVRGIGRMG